MFAGDGKVKATIETMPLESLNNIFERLRAGEVKGRVVLGIGEHAFESEIKELVALA